jgi:hypothetical protein
MNSEVYNSSEMYPSRVAKLEYQTDLAGQSMAVISIYPVQYNPVGKNLFLANNITLIIEGTGGYECGDYLPANISDRGRKSYEKMLNDMVINPQDVMMVSRTPMVSGVSAGDYDYVIITSSSWDDDFQPLADWKTQKGIKANIVSTTWIYNSGGYSGSNQQKIRAFVDDAHGTWGATYFLLGGDTGVVPYHTNTSYSDDIPNDTYYGDYDSDFTCEVHVGRASVTGTSAIDTFIDKIITYETSPPSSYPKKIALFGFDLDGWTDGEDCKDYIDDYYVPSGWTVNTVYDSDGGNHESYVKAAINDGQNLINHIDHCDYDIMGVGSNNHDYWLNTGEVDNFYNGDKQSILYTIGCWASAWDYSACISEHFVRDGNGGCVAFVGNTRYGWYNSGSISTLSMLYDRYFFRSLFDQGHYILGECFSDHKNDGPTGNSTERYIFTELNLLGDPELPIWTENPQSLTTSHDATIPMNGSYFTVHVESSGSDVSGATVCIWKDGDFHEVGTTNYNGDATIYVDPASTGTFYVTATKHNYLPEESTAEVSMTGGPDVMIDMVPYDDPVYTVQGGSFDFIAKLYNTTGTYQYTDVWIMLVLPNDAWYGPINRWNNIPLAPYDSLIDPNASQYIPGYAMIGEYEYWAYCGDYPSTKLDSAWFDFMIFQGLAKEGGDWNVSLFDDVNPIPTSFALSANYPNPFNAQTNITFDLPEASDVNLSVYNVLGQKVDVLIDSYKNAGSYTVSWDASTYSSGVYFYKLTAGNYSDMKQMHLLK